MNTPRCFMASSMDPYAAIATPRFLNPALGAEWPEIDRLLDEALDLDPLARGAWLSALPPSPHKDWLIRLLGEAADGAETQDFLRALPSLSPAALRHLGDPVDGIGEGGFGEYKGGLKPGDEVGPWRIVRELGHGGMGSVWLAERRDGALNRQVALKLPHAAWTPGLAERLQRERDILATLVHPHIARLYDAGVDAHGRPWLALEYVQGRPIDAYVQAEGASVRTRVQLIVQVAQAVAYAHSRLVIHRDLKPSNILVSDPQQVHLLDFGIAKLMAEDDAAGPTILTQLGGRVLTPQYASPEQIRGEPLGTASDVYSLGVVAYELLTGRHPHRLDKGSAADWEKAVTTLEPARASDVAGTETTRRQLRGDLDAILQKALKKLPAERYATPAALAEDLGRHLQGHAVLARPDSAAYRLRKLVLRNKLAAGAGGAVALALVAGLGVALWQADQARRSERQARAALAREDAVKELYLETLSQVASWDAQTLSKPGAVSRGLQAKLDAFERRYAASAETRAGLLRAVSTTLPFMEDYAGAERISRRYQAALKEAGAPSGRQLRASVQTARALLMLGRAHEAEDVLRRALTEWPVDDGNATNHALVTSELAKVLQRLGRRDEAEQVHAQAVGSLRADTTASDRFNVSFNQGRLYIGYDDARALRLLQVAQDDYGKRPEAFPMELGYGHYSVGQALFGVGRPTEAEAELRTALERWRPTVGVSDSIAVLAVGHLSRAVAAQGRHDEALALLAARETELAAAPESPAGTAARTMLTAFRAELLVARGDPAAARRLQPIDPRTAPAPLLRDAQSGVYARALAQALIAHDLAADALALTEHWRAAAAAAAPQSPGHFSIELAAVEAEHARGRHDAARRRADALIDAMRRMRATGTWLYREALETAALTQVLADPSTPPAQALEPWTERAAGAAGATHMATPPAPSAAARADSLLRRAAVLRALNRSDEVESLSADVERALAADPAGSPRRVQWQRLRAAG